MRVTTEAEASDLALPNLSGRSMVRGARRPRRQSEQLTQMVPLDRRTRLGRAVGEFRADLYAHVGKSPSVTQRAAIELACQLRIRLASMDFEFAQRGGMTAHDSRVYISWANALRRTLSQLGLQAAPKRPISLQEHLAGAA